MIDADKEVAKLEEKKNKLGLTLKKLQDAVAKPDYESKVPENVRKQNTEKVREVVTSLRTFSTTPTVEMNDAICDENRKQFYSVIYQKMVLLIWYQPSLEQTYYMLLSSCSGIVV